MSFDWHEYLEFAQTVLTKTSEFSNPEAVYRAVVSRSYYAVYCSTRNLVKAKDHREFTGNAHQQLQDHLIEHTHKTRKRLGQRLKRLHQLRLIADYENVLRQQPLSLAQQAITQAKEIEKDLEELQGKKSTG